MQKKRNGHVDFVEKRRPDADLVARYPFGKDRKKRSPQYGKTRGEKNQIVKEKTGLARNERIQLIVASQIIAILIPSSEAGQKNYPEKGDKPPADRRLCKRMHRTDDTGARQHRAEDAQHEGYENEPDIPSLHHAALFLHHHRMQESRASDPWQQRSILDGIPGPIPAPSEDGISPVGAEQNANSKKTPSDHRPAPRNVNPFLTGIAAEQRRHGECEGNRESGISEIKHRWMDHHLGILQ